MDKTNIIGIIAGTLTTVSMVPQLIKIWNSKSTKDISLVMYTVICFGIFLWLVFGLLINSLPVIIANAVSFVLAFTVLVFKIRYK